MSDQMANDMSLFCSDFGDESDLDNDESVASDSLIEKHTDPENYRKSFASAIDDEQSRLFSAVPIRRARVYDFDFKHEVSAALDFELRDNSGNATLSKQELENKNHQCALKRVDYPKTAKFNLVYVKVHDKSGYGHDETLLEESDDEASFGIATVKKIDHDIIYNQLLSRLYNPKLRPKRSYIWKDPSTKNKAWRVEKRAALLEQGIDPDTPKPKKVRKPAFVKPRRRAYNWKTPLKNKAWKSVGNIELAKNNSVTDSAKLSQAGGVSSSGSGVLKPDSTPDDVYEPMRGSLAYLSPATSPNKFPARFLGDKEFDGEGEAHFTDGGEEFEMDIELDDASEDSDAAGKSEEECAPEKKHQPVQLPKTNRQLHMLIMKHKDSLYDYSLKEHMIQDGAGFVLRGALDKVRWSNTQELTPGEEVALHQSLEWLHAELNGAL